ncbi:hypothetical protein, variant 2 [Aphanomyces astaci]|uniref:Uncharacterized protein n=1 Tax=Aphanomyces astaci TaxID=112090 RepID=W4FEX4_APHAT|nr:hypothetical protein, variant 3 [Aphanomyces astaci]XP_009845081.1 hypothetical protein, variant 2 [Aphanomyces astaci]ETV65438.1 hypothetical protein, variant 2 [Aphanomyces astaci]ETV65439.1 hypothetical protein, variant 3 [Aphanomyces astaci]|eukprot:XP_009845080.1 hypothetical protein, variant 3 [Aphanomyces astaci]
MTSNTGETNANSTDAALTTVDNTLARRRYFREKQRNYRRKVNVDVAIVEAELAHLQSIRDILQASMPPSIAPREASDGLLSWYSIATVLKREVRRVLMDRQPLIRQTQRYQYLTKAMQRFVMMSIPSPMSRSNTWQNATLAAEPSARYLGKEWLMQQMYHNTRQALALLPAMTCDDEFFQFDLQVSDQHDDLFMERIQCIFPGTLASFRRFVKSNRMRDMLFKGPQDASDTVYVSCRTDFLLGDRRAHIQHAIVSLNYDPRRVREHTPRALLRSRPVHNGHAASRR